MTLKNIKIDEFVDLLNQKQLICFGAGRGLKAFCDKFAEYHIEEHIAYIVDNAPKKWGTSENCGSKEIDIISPEECRRNLNKNTILLITCLDVEAILMQLNAWHEFAAFECYFYAFIMDAYFAWKALNSHMPSNYKIFPTQQIPKIIHYCWFGKNPLPERYKEWMKSWKEYCPDYEIVEWNESNYDVTKNEYMRQAYGAKKWGFVPDYARLDIIYNHGGIYLDTDVELIRNLDELLYQEAFCGFDYSQYIAFGLGFGAAKNIPIIKEMRDQYEYLAFVNADGGLNQTPSNIYLSDFFVRKGLKLNGEFQEIEKLRIYPGTLFCGIMGSTMGTGEKIITENTFSIHHFDGSWGDPEQKKKSEAIKNLYRKLSINVK